MRSFMARALVLRRSTRAMTADADASYDDDDSEDV
jgi:hypothetical protein